MTGLPRHPEPASALARASRALDRLYLACGAIAAFLLVCMTSMILISVVSRMIGVFVAGINEVAGYTMAASAFFAMAYTFRSGGHIRVELLLSGLPARPRRVAEIWCLCVLTFAAGYLAWHLTMLVRDSRAFGEVSEGADALPLWLVQMPMAAGAVVFALSAAHALVQALGRSDTVGPDGRALTSVEVETGQRDATGADRPDQAATSGRNGAG